MISSKGIVGVIIWILVGDLEKGLVLSPTTINITTTSSTNVNASNTSIITQPKVA